MNLPTTYPIHASLEKLPQAEPADSTRDLGNQATGSEEMEPICTKHRAFGVGDLEPIRSGDTKSIAFIVL